ncbi:MAG: helix-turn-helix domain-containing protein [Clostridia bacterium]|nr:helix-turn-helix domain-containing protein [Clostridia bacterium]
MSVGKNIEKYRRARGLSMEELGRMLGVSRQTVFRYENGKIENIPHERLEKIATALQVTPSQLYGWDEAFGIQPILRRRVPMIGEIACGKPIYAEESFGEYAVAEGIANADFCLRARGDSMTGARIFDGDVVFIHAQSTLENGEIGAVIIGDEATLKRVYYYPDKQKLILLPENPAYEPLVYIGEDLEQVHILGKAVAFQSTVR